ncbi:ribosome assembly RNA-binding protein YhbY [Ligilactobacillus salivarius]|uniref:ribosome assembly RNA-binding protein YhbY n=1 Tax=Ligilactobacillus salivarius TaxID=1624 RepID=UPI000BB03DED|nr:ribosome assembly RNA-binding protein YhbY [Ligilactobacillus salivarius]MBE7387443.1 ribosome assembly RNA-binding protein YhbY [Ligilactobacillus salivarius]MBE7391837.1 ribosome assembly RNA-binding protein YhbY [Ligilactobacillus salivarius]PAY32284.1 RNA-binding protein [Ligilactobacillus salivarius]PAY37925.1 RNA-binding protein [Ligilactobacillus salivarius]PAY45461.1 RNA-binding protein [Ligilactobacillus salivarius]
MKLRGKQKRYLRSEAHHLKPIFQIGKDGLSEVWLDEVLKALDKRELLKVNILQNSLVEVEEVKEFIENNSDAQVIQTIGNVLVLFKKSGKTENQKISVKVAEL